MSAALRIGPNTARLADTFEVYRVRSLAWHNAQPELIHATADRADALDYGQSATQPKDFFFVRQIHALTGAAVDSFYVVRQTSKHRTTRQAYDGPYTVSVKGRIAEHLFDVAREGGAA